VTVTDVTPTATGPVRLVPRPLWIGSARCRGMDPSVFYPGRGDNAGMQQAKRICASCDVRQECLEESLVDESGWPGPDGVRGGLSARERRALLREQRIARRS
jgi:WhiB family redox-sensing transcriptional regulator